ncbi:lysophospholipid acyltransferase family protein [Microbacterium esteraromaticum]|uniref:lysophospholipid acyltransferase family protein n=1 Tax=Microbacterium esteraromaticum TaxID=57043 RepID=UPI0015C9C099|nr:lysophospholipid acyltransferase family protein [Microbacterium esteraromaticum]MBN7792751.1 1-acyl-sn-glycerol-3-phosphate acyltransferase [Microbacterium esteraromaticum]MBY6060955.1 1-acyl-sn-glycerol-3-phosphate acyltransferase [Microbacterium esteraromaticum]MCA1306139.1 1-acyl-sn-glycerol-3-phosphate acyltransferase [Microbacterium esteraromaticum]WDH80084.1 lysophospholipid acyltransferase family protein [Microbacterium esteraromaticum]
MAVSERSRPSIFWPLAAIVVPVLGLIAKVTVRGDEKLPRQGAFVLAPNHYSEFDPLIIALAVFRTGRLPRFMAKESLFRVPVVGWVLRKSGMIPVARTSSASAAKQTMTQSRELVEHGRGVIVYPEGTLTRDPDLWPMRGKSGAVRLALTGDIPLIPVAHWGTQKIMGRYQKGLSLWPPRKPVHVLYGDPVDLSDLRGRAGEPGVLAEATDRLMAAITALLEELRGEQAPAQRWNPAQHGQNETGRLEP